MKRILQYYLMFSWQLRMKWHVKNEDYGFGEKWTFESIKKIEPSLQLKFFGALYNIMQTIFMNHSL